MRLTALSDLYVHNAFNTPSVIKEIPELPVLGPNDANTIPAEAHFQSRIAGVISIHEMNHFHHDPGPHGYD